MRSDVPLYVMEFSGRLVKMKLGSGERTLLSDHRFYMTPTLLPSRDGRWLSYNGVLKGTGKTQYWMYDRHKQNDHLVYEHPAWGGGIPGFSPDSRYLAISASHDSRWTDTSRVGIFLFDTTTMRLIAVPFPPLRVNRTAYVSAGWSHDGKSLLILMRNMATKEGFDYFSYRIATGRLEKLAGRYNRSAIRHEFLRGARVIPAYEDLVLPSSLGGQSAWNAGHTLHAHFDNSRGADPYQLIVTSDKGVARPVAVGRYTHCEGRTLVISGWLDERHLVFRDSVNYFIFDAQTGTTAHLFNEDDMSIQFTW
ncbi:hypothetical protein C7C56_014115 [Massilia glaciei]|uniref:DUF5050 domain-containing protein n=2 Tax=Massilia glaciei TaxID=1524097 RepID=A0A2U2HJI3_9BURK|nr:hypothetical protein C7C56_014115 [Massilia glaciei]